MKSKYFLFLFFICFLWTATNSLAQNKVKENYSFYKTTSTYTEITGGTQLDVTTIDDEVYANQAIGFSFRYNGKVYTTLHVCANGFVSFGTTSTTSTTPISSTLTWDGAISAMGADLVNETLAEIRIQTTGSSPDMVCTIQYKKMKRFGATENLNFQIKLYETSDKIEFVYGSITGDTGSGLQVGLRGITQDDYNNRTTTTDWTATTNGTNYSSTCTLSSTVKPSSGLTFVFTPFQYAVDKTCTTAAQDISVPGNALTLTSNHANVTLPFNFNFYGTISNQIRISQYGGILFGTTTGSIASTNAALAAGTLALFPYWDYLVTGTVYSYTIGVATNRVHIVQWKLKHNSYPALGEIDFQVQFYETSNKIVFVYSDLEFGNAAVDYGKSATVGIQGTSNFLQSTKDFIFNNTCLTYYTCYPPSANITKSACTGSNYNVTVQIYDLGQATGADIVTVNATGVSTTQYSNQPAGTYTINNLSGNQIVYVKDKDNLMCSTKEIFASCEVCSSTSKPHDNCASAPDIDLSQPFAGSTACAYTVSTSAPESLPDFPSCGAINNDSWIRFQAGAAEVVIQLDLGDCTLNSGVQIQVLSGSCGSFTQVANSCINPTGEMASVIWNFSGLTSGNFYYIWIDGYSGDFCEYTFTPISGVVVRPDNDVCSTAKIIACGDNIISNTTRAATDVITPCVGAYNKGVWYKFTGDGKQITLSTDNSNTNFNTEINVFTGTCPGSLTCIGGNDDGAGVTVAGSSKYVFDSNVGTEYYIFVDGKTGDGQFELSIACEDVTPPTITVQPATVSICSDEDVTFSLTATGPAPITYQWQYNIASVWTNLSNDATYSGVTTNTLTINRTLAGDFIGTEYKCLVDNNSPTTTTSSTVTINAASPTDPIGASASPATILNGESTTLSYTGGAGTTFKWYTVSCGGTLAGTGNSLIVSPTTTTTYYGRWEKVCGNSNCATVTVNVTPVYNVTGTLKYKNAGTTALNGQTVNLSFASKTTTTDASGAFSFSGVPDGTYTITPVITKSWGGVSAMDVTKYQKHLIASPALTGLYLASGDVNAGGLSAADFTHIYNKIVSLIPASWPSSNFVWTSDDIAFSNVSVTVSGGNATSNILALCYGDANASYTPAAKQEFASIDVLSEEVIYFENNDNFELPVKVNTELKNLSSITLEMFYNSKNFKINEIVFAENNERVHYSVSNDKVNIVYSNLNVSNYKPGDVLFFVRGTILNISSQCNLFTAVGGEFGDSDDMEITDIEFSMPELSSSDVTGLEFTEKTVLVYPNPANSYLYISNIKDSKVEICDMYGKVLISRDIDYNNAKLDIQTLANGTYFIKISKSGEVITRKFSIVK